MTKLKRSKLNHLLSYQPQGVVITSTWLREHHYSRFLVNYYCKKKWLKKIGDGAYSRLNESVAWPGGVYALQQGLRLPVNVGGLTVLELHGLAQNVVFNQQQNVITLFNNTKDKHRLPKWFTQVFPNHDYFQHIIFVRQLGLEEKKVDGILLQVSSPERAILEVLDLVPNHFSYEHAKDLVENLQLIRPDLMQELLENCTSIKVKRLFLYLADHYQLPSFKYFKISKIDLGRGKRVIGSGGMYIPQYQLSVPAPQGEEEGIGYV